MATLVRRVRSQLRHSTDDTDLPPPLPAKDAKHQFLTKNRHSRCDLSTAVESTYSIHNRQQGRHQTDQSPVAELRRRLVRKASTFSLRIKGRRTDSKILHEHLPNERTLSTVQKGREESVPSIADEVLDVETVQETIVPSTTPHIVTQQRPSISTSSCATAIPSSSSEAPNRTSGLEQSNKHSTQQQVEKDEKANAAIIDLNWSTMASENAAPPVPYERMKDIATSACDTALSSITKYSHSDTESWNTTIINTILAALVEETTPSATSQTPSAQPQFKYVVNSTIIQHASSSATIEDGTKASGRRGMHSASGAYWNNEKDGMWSFKYEAAEAKGLDVVVGIIWVWVG